MGIRGNSAADTAAKDALDGDISDEFIPFSVLKSYVNKYVCFGSHSGEKFPENKLHKTFPNLKNCTICPWTDRREDTVISSLHVGHCYITHSYLLMGEEPPVCITCDKRLTVEHILLFCCD